MTEHPRLSIVTPSFNQATYLERTIRSVLDQNYPNLEYIVIDGGSTDGSIEIIERYAGRLAYWTSEPDHGQTNAINKGLRRATGDWVAWQNSDDVYFPGAFEAFARTVARKPHVGLVIGDMIMIDAEDKPVRDLRYLRPTYNSLRAEGMLIANQASFWHRKLHDRIGYLDESLHYAFDYEWFLRLLQHTSAAHLPEFWGALRLHGETKSTLQTARFAEEIASILKGREPTRKDILLSRLRRTAVLVAQGRLGYIGRGLFHRANTQ